jgi:predicted nucleic-acid-binding Zn-ribbon protein
MGVVMERYDITDVFCRKCGSHEHTVAFQNAGKHRDYDGVMRVYKHDFLACRCKRCGYSWNTLPIDTVD